jgi:hypothetical protein
VRLVAVPVLARLGRRLGYSWAALGERWGRESLLAQVRSIETTPPAQSGSRPLDVVHLTMIGGHTYNSSMDVALGLALRARGHRVRFVVCDQMLPLCEVKKAGQERNWSRACAKCWAFGREYFTAAGLEVLPVSEFLPAVAQEPSRWKHIVSAALLKHFRVGLLEDSEVVRQRRHDYEHSAAISEAVGRRLVEMGPDRVVMSHGIYCTWAPARELLAEAGIPVVIYAKGKKRHTERFTWNDPRWNVTREWEKVKETPLTTAQSHTLDQYLGTRRDHSQDARQYNFGPEESPEVTRSRFRLDPAKQTFALFTNVLWDASSAQHEIAFESPVQWVLETIRWFADRPEKQLIVKIHPAESVIGTEQPFAEIIRREFAELPANVRLIGPTETVNSWSIAAITNVALVHTSTVGFEYPTAGVPVICVSRAHYRGKGFTVDVDSRDQYFQLLENWGSSDVDRERISELARRYAYLVFERYQLPWRAFFEPRHTDVRALTFASVAGLLQDPTIQLVVQSIEQQTDFLLPLT